MIKNPKTVLSVSLAKQVIDGLSSAKGETRAEASIYRLSARQTLGQGLYLSIDIPADDTMKIVNTNRHTRYLDAGYTLDQLRKAVNTLYWKAHRSYRLLQEQNAVYALVEAKLPGDKPAPFIIAVEQTEKETGHTCIYEKMTHEDCLFWTEFINKYGG